LYFFTVMSCPVAVKADTLAATRTPLIQYCEAFLLSHTTPVLTEAGAPATTAVPAPTKAS